MVVVFWKLIASVRNGFSDYGASFYCVAWMLSE